MNTNPYNSNAKPHYDSYEDFYKFFEVAPREFRGEVFPEVFPPAEVLKVEKEKGRLEKE